MVNSKNKKQPSVEIIILTHNNKGILSNCLKSLNKLNYVNKKISVVDQNSSDGTYELIKKRFKYINLVRNKINKSFSKGNNDILKKSKADYCLLLNDDTEVDKNFLKKLVSEAKNDNKLAALQPKILDLKNKKKFEYAGASGGFIDIYGYPLCRGRIFEYIEEDKKQYDDAREVFWSCAVAMLLNMSILKSIGYLDEDIGSYAEELDFCWRANLAGYKIKVIPKSIVYHLGSQTWKKKSLELKKEYLLFRNHFFVLLKNYSIKSWIKIIPMKLFLEFIAAINYLFKKPKRSLAIILANAWIFTHIGIIKRKNKEIDHLRKISDKKIMKKMMKRSIVIEHFLKGKNKFSEIVGKIESY